MKNKYYITTPIYSPSGNWHVGHCYTTVICDAAARFKRMTGHEVFFLTGTDDHGEKIYGNAKKAGKSPKDFVDGLCASIKEMWALLDISYDKFIRTTDGYHIKSVQAIFKKLYDKGEIYKSEYKGHYCIPCESFWTDSQLKEGKCPDCGRAVEVRSEEAYFFRLSKYTDKLTKLLSQTDFLEPKFRVTEMINNFLKPGLTDICVSRTSFTWGVPVDFDKGHIVYVWIDALTNYITALGYGGNDDTLYKKFWPADMQVMAKEIVRFHAIIWPALLMALEVPLPKKLYGHGWFLIGGDKLSKSKGDKAKAELICPKMISERYGSDTLRYFLLREGPFREDTPYTTEAFLSCINSDLVNSYGNLVSRTLAMVQKYQDGKLIKPKQFTNDFDKEIISLCGGLYQAVEKSMDTLNAPAALETIFTLINRLNKYIDQTTPWKLDKTADDKKRLEEVLYVLCEGIRISSVALLPFLTKLPVKVLGCLKTDTPDNLDSIKKFGLLKSGTQIIQSGVLFARIDIQKELKEIENMLSKPQDTVDEVSKTCYEASLRFKQDTITIDEFSKTKLKAATVLSAEIVEKSDKLLKLVLDLGTENRTVVSGIRQHYKPEELLGKKVVVVANLEKAVIRGIESQGMILCAESDGKVSLVAVRDDVKNGSEIR